MRYMVNDFLGKRSKSEKQFDFLQFKYKELNICPSSGTKFHLTNENNNWVPIVQLSFSSPYQGLFRV